MHSGSWSLAKAKHPSEKVRLQSCQNANHGFMEERQTKLQSSDYLLLFLHTFEGRNGET
jgi:hypothetical protein